MTAVRVRLGWAIALLLVAALEFVSSYDGIAAPAAFGLAAVLPFALVRAGQLLRAGTFGPALITILLAAAAAGLALRRSSGGSLGGIGDALPRLLTTPRPAPATAALLAPPVLLVALVATVVAACVLAPGGDAGGRVGGLLAPVLGAAAVYVGAQLLAAGAADRHGVVAVCLLVVAALGWSTPYLRGGLAIAWRPGAVLPLAAAVAVALLAAAVTPAAAFDPRRHVTPPTVHLDEPSPLSQLASWSANPSVAILQAKVSGTGRLHLAALSRFTGDSWQVDDRYRELGLIDSGDLPRGQRSVSVAATVRIDRLAGVWLPAPGVARSSSLSGVLIDPDAGTLARPPQVRAGLTYDVRARVDAPTARQLAAASVPKSVPARYLALPDAPLGFAQYARAAVRGASTPLEEAIALEHAVATGRRVDPKAPTGSSYGRLQQFLFGTAGTAGVGVGTDEQFAAGFAVLAREVGLPTRLVVGFVLGRPAADGTVTVRGGDATVWPEVYFAGAGWVPFAPTPGGGDGAADATLRQSVLQRLSEQASVLPVPPPIAPAPNRSTGPTPPPGTHARADRPTAALSPAALAALVTGGVLVLALLLLVGLRRLRSIRHRRQGARGAWAELVDLLVLVGRRPGPGEAAPAVAATFAATFPPVPQDSGTAGRIAAIAEREAFTPDRPAAADDLWRELSGLRRRARRTLPRRRRVLLPVDPRPLLAARRR